MLTLLVYSILILMSAIAKVEQLFNPALLASEKTWMINYRFDNENSWFCQLCKHIPTECPATKIGLPPMCKLNPLFDQVMLMQLKAADPVHQDDWIGIGNSM